MKSSSFSRSSTRLWLALVLALAPMMASANLDPNPPNPKSEGDDPCDTGNDCVNFMTSFPVLPLEEGLGFQNFQIKRNDPTPALFTPQSLNHTTAVLSYVASITNASNLPAGVSHQFLITNAKGEAVEYRVPAGSSIGKVVGAFTGKGDVVVILDENYSETTSTPEYYRLLRGDGTYVEFPAKVGRVASGMKLQSGRVIDLGRDENSTFDVVFQDGYFRQIRSAVGLADVVIIDDFGYEIRFYNVTNQGQKVNGFYQPQNQPYRVIEVRNPTGNVDLYNTIRITDTQGSYSNIYQWSYIEAADDWVLTEGIDPNTGIGLVSEQKIVVTDPTTGDRIITTESRDTEGNLISRNRVRDRSFAWGRGGYIEEVKDVDGFALTTLTEYYTNSSETGRYGNRKSISNPDGSWTAYDYDSDGRVIQMIEPWQDSVFRSTAAQAKETTYNFTPVDALDVADVYDARARTTIVKGLGVETERTYNVYYTDINTGEFMEIEERTTVQGAAYGTMTNLRTTRVYYAADANTASAGRLKTVATPDGVVEAYSYAQVDAASDFIETVDRLTTSGPLANKSTRSVVTKDARGNRIKEESFVHDGTDWQLYSTTTQTFSDEMSTKGFQLTQRVKDGRVTLNQSWYGPLVGSQTNEAGIEYLYNYDLLDRLEMEVKMGINGAEDIITTYDRDLGALDCGCDGSRSMERTAGGITLSTVSKTDSAGRRSEMTDENGYTTTYSYVDDQRVTTVTMPNGSTRITEKFLDGRVKSITGTGVIPEYYSYSINADGSTTIRVDVATAISPRYRETTYDVAGRMITEESPAFDGSTFTRTMSYNDKGLLAKQAETGRAATLYEYDSLANLTRSGLDIDGNDQLDLASTDRITDTDRFMEEDGTGDWFAISTTAVYPETGVASAVQVSRTARRLSNFALATANGDLASETVAIDVHGNTTINTSYVDRATKTVTQITDTPDSTIDVTRVSTNGLPISQNSSTVAAATTYGYDAVERRISLKDPRHAQAATMDYYTDSMQLFTQTDAAGNTTAYTYYPQGSSGAGQVASVTDALLQKSYQAYDLLGRQIQTWGETDYPQAYSYNSYGELATLTTWRDIAIDFSTATWPSPAGGDVTTWSYQASTGLLTRKEYADAEGTDYTYDSANRLSVRTWARDAGLDTTYSYDATTGELLNVNYESINTADITYNYDRLGRQATVIDATGTRSFVYDNSSLQLDVETLDATFYQGQILDRDYEDNAGIQGRYKGYSLKDSGGTTSVSSATYGYETTGRLLTITDGTDTFTYGYEADSNLLASLAAPQHTVAYTYEPNRNVMTTIDNKVSNVSLSAYTYSYDALGRRDDRQQSGSAITATSTDDFAYNTRSEVIASTNSFETAAQWNPTYTFDQIGNRKSSTGFQPVASYSSNSVNQYTAIDAVNPTHDLDGNLSSNSTWTYSWNNENRLSSATDGSVTIDFVYDYQGRLAKKDDGTNVEVYVYDGWNRIGIFALQTSNLTLQTSYLWGTDLSGTLSGAGGVGGLLKEGVYYPLFDANGNIMQKLDGAGATAMNVDYDPFGNIISGTLVGEYGFSTKPLIDGLQWYYYGFRYYDPVTGRWPNRDPLGEWGGLNLYRMIGNHLINSIDYLGWYELQYDMFDTFTSGERDKLTDSLDRVNKRIKDVLIPDLDAQIAEISGKDGCCWDKLKAELEELKSVFESVLNGINSSSENLEIERAKLKQGTDAQIDVNPVPFVDPVLQVDDKFFSQDMQSMDEDLMHELSHIYGTEDHDKEGDFMNAHRFDDFMRKKVSEGPMFKFRENNCKNEDLKK